ncbi:exodeoxyribonuclease III [Ruminococcus albus]|uniref:Exodeoxyribonuclease III n=1 Tax=Ruminococcus albus 8 TaxID=246199 RepID=E9SC29_RUMAL|nr:exodeoxyribonuclease III [Ruminococcus albus]EGC03207.1 exodeoxyribonuclease III [Ruminococcus albus 8]MCC3351960.1 exodeoxyribonuclease III [Ruminococcus albus 8]
MKLISWNVNGFRACLQKGFEDFFKSADADIFCIQETKMQPDQADFSPEGYHKYFHSAVKKGYSGTAVYTKNEPKAVTYGLNGAHTDEGRVITCEYDDFYFVCCYVPNAQNELKRIDYRMEFEDDMRAYLCGLDKLKPVIYCGDLNVAHEEIDLKNPKSNVGNAGFSDQERGKFTELLAAGFADTFRRLYPETTGVYSWWSYRFNARKNNAGWRIDYFVVSERLMDKVGDSKILTDVMGSDHCPVQLDITI